MLTRILIPILILAAGYGAWSWLGQKTEAPTFEAQEQNPIKTERIILTRTDFPVILKSQGSVRAHHDTVVTSQVPGIITKIHPTFEDGAFFKQGDILVEIDPGDLEAARSAAESKLARAEAMLAQEEAKAKQARLNWEDIGYTEEPSPLVLRIPQLKDARAQVAAAQVDLDQAIRNLDRSKIRAPFDGRVKNRTIGLGQSVNGTTPLGEIFATDIAEVRLPLSADQLVFVHLPRKDGDPTVPVTLIDALGKTQNNPNTWQARIIRSEGTLDENSNELFVIARIDDPFGLQSDRAELKIGQPVRAEIGGVTLPDVFVVPRSSLRGVNRIYLIDRDSLTLTRRNIEPLWSTEESFIVKEGIENGEWLASSVLPYTPLGAKVEIIDGSTIVADPGHGDATTEGS